MRPPLSLIDRAKLRLGMDSDLPVQRLTRKEFYDLAEKCRAYSEELARYDQHRVSLKHCHEFNQWLPELKSYDLLAPHLSSLRPARPIARWQVLVLAIISGLLLFLFLGPRLGQMLGSMLLYGYIFFLVMFIFFVPQRLYGTTIELLEAKVLRVVEALESVLRRDDLGFSEGAYFRVKEDLQQSRKELRQQIDLAHRRWR